MPEPRVPGGGSEELSLACGESVDPRRLDLGMRSFECDCGDTHAVVMDVHPPSRFVPEFLVDILRETIETDDEFDEFGTPHVMGVLMEEFPEDVVTLDKSDDGNVGYGLLWVTEFDDRELHEIVVELLVELMEHAISHADSTEAMSAFEEQMLEFDVDAFVEQYRAERNLETEHDTAI
jgi:hypothetical protein